ncbi:MAG: YeeE/YedE family protein [Sphingobacteriaceae bacterium]|nr:MAG: YeeE/YedE family protein [Sphingobacteriaceae bacterium]
MKGLKFVIAGIVFGIIMVKSEAASWYRIQEMFRFQSFQMYGIIGTAVVLGIIAVYLIKKNHLKDTDGHIILFHNKDKRWPKYIIGGTIFGLGWALAGACPGPMFVNFGYGYYTMILVIIGALLGTYVYGALKTKLPH